MREPLILHGASYTDATPDGAFAALIPGRHVRTHQGEIPFHIQDGLAIEPVHLACTDVAGFQIAGQASVFTVTPHYRNGQWVLRPWTVFASQGVLFDATGALLVAQYPGDHYLRDGSRVDAAMGVDGFRGLGKQGDVVLGNTSVALWNGFNERLDFGDVVIGQGHHGGTLAFFQGKHYLIEPGFCRFIKVQRRADRFAVSIVKETEGRAAIYWFTLAEITHFATYTLPVPQPIPHPQPSPQPIPQPTPMPTVPNYVEYVRKRAEQFPGYTNDELTDEQRIDAAAKLTAIVAHDIHFGKNGAPTDTRVGLFAKGNKYGYDENRLFFLFRAENVCCFAKIVIQTGASWASIGWNETETFFPDGTAQFTVPPAVPGVHDGTPPPEPPLPPLPAELTARVSALERQLVHVMEEQQALARAINETENRINNRLQLILDNLPKPGPVPPPLPSDVVRESTHQVKTNAGRFLGTFTGTIERKS